MRTYGRLLAFICLFAFPFFAKADGMDFNMNVQDPTVSFQDITGPTFSFSFGSCLLGEAAQGCFYADNETGETLTSMTLVVPDEDYILQTNQTASCGGGSGGSLFMYSNCPADPVDGSFTLNFYGGQGIASSGVAALFEITESDGDPSPTSYDDFPTVAGSVAYTPEPSSLLLLGTGLACLAGLWFKGFVQPGREERN